jgi:hypothetical protein
MKLGLVVLCLALQSCALAGPSRSRDRQRAYSAFHVTCQDICSGGSSVDEHQNCISKCVSPDCFKRIYGQQPLEDGEIDEFRKNKFNSCLSSERRTARDDKNWKGENNVSEKERIRRDSDWPFGSEQR